MAVASAMSDFTFMTDEGRLFVNSPDAVDGNTKAKCDTSSADFQEKEGGNVDFVGKEAEVIEKVRELITLLPGNNEDVAAAEPRLRRH